VAIGYLTSNGTVREEEASTADKKLKELYDIVPVDLKASPEVPKDVKTLIIAGPKEKFGDNELKAIDAFFSRGGNLLVFLDGVNADAGLTAEKNQTGLEGLLAKYGIRANSDLIADPQSGIASFNQGMITFSIEYPYWPKVLKGGFDKNVSAVSNLETVILPWVSSVDAIPDKMDKNNQISNLIFSSNKSWRVSDNFNISPQQIPAPAEGVGKYNLALFATGNFQSAYDGKKTFNSRIAVIGDSDFIRDNFLNNAPDNLALYQNLTDILSLDQDLVNIRSKGVTSRPIKELSDASKAVLRYGNVFGVTLIVIIFGTIRYLARRKRKDSEI